MNLTLIAKENIPYIWEKMVDDFRQVLETHGQELELDGVYTDLTTGENQLWLYAIHEQVSGWAITAIVTYHKLKRLRVILMGGLEMKLWLHHIDIIEQWATDFGVTESEAWVRPGLRKALEAFGYEKAYEVIVKPIEKKVKS